MQDITNNNKSAIRVLLIDSHPITLLGIRTLLQEQADISLIDALSVPAGILDLITQQCPDIVLMDIRTADGKGMEVVRSISTLNVPTRVVVLTAALNDSETCELIRLGVKGVLLKEMPTYLIIQCLRRVSEGGKWFERRSMTSALELVLKREMEFQELSHCLSVRELELAMLIATGCRNKTASKYLGLSVGSVSVYLNRIYRKLNVSNRLEMTLFLKEKGVI
jgi:DNA-binding NarL/FixJ family response regulator